MHILEFAMFAVVAALLAIVLYSPFEENAAKRGVSLVNGAPSIADGARLVGGGA